MKTTARTKEKKKCLPRTRRVPYPPEEGLKNPLAISIANRKGGVGKTTFTANIGHELYRAGYSVALLDLDSQMDLTEIFLGSRPHESDLFQVIKGTADPVSSLVNVWHEERMKILPGSEKLSRIGSDVTASLQEAVEEIKEVADIILLDHPPGLTRIAGAGFAASDYLMIVVEAEGLSYRNTHKLLDDVEEIKESENPGLEVAGIAVNRVDRRRNLTDYILKQLSSKYGDLMFEQSIGTDTGVPNSQADNGMGPIRKLPWRSRAVSQFQNLAAELLLRLDLHEEVKKSDEDNSNQKKEEKRKKEQPRKLLRHSPASNYLH